MEKKTILWAVVLGVLGLGIYLWMLWQPEKQVRLHQKHLLEAFESRDKGEVSRFVGDKYSDRWGHDKAFLSNEGTSVLRQFLVLTIEAEEKGLKLAEGKAAMTQLIRIQGKGSPVADLVVERVNGLKEPFIFHWQKKSGKPWDWELVEIEHASLEIREF